MLHVYIGTSLFPSPEFLDEQSLIQMIRTLLTLLIPVPSCPPLSLFLSALIHGARGCLKIHNILSSDKSSCRCYELKEASRPHTLGLILSLAEICTSTHLEIATCLGSLEANEQNENTQSRIPSWYLPLFKICDVC